MKSVQVLARVRGLPELRWPAAPSGQRPPIGRSDPYLGTTRIVRQHFRP